MKFSVNGSSSKGNNIIVENILMLDCGLSYFKTATNLSKVKIIFISHSHNDHMRQSTIKKIAYNFPNIVYVTRDKQMVYRLYKLGVPMNKIFHIKNNNWYDLKLLKIKIDKLTHDTPNYALHFEINGEKGIYICDTANVDNIIAKNYNLYLIEANYNEKVLKEHIESCDDEGELKYLQRVPLTHLSYEQSNDFLIKNMGDKSEFYYLHKSSYNFKEEGEN